ncbi:MAG: nucleotidyl transferase AbiEii/AbiGii toxin family protein [Myxococcales bacterium]|nr:nucleotidyl transferase AbiEii/AbiGii toxin family protein [Myxococcales bacterium]
MSVDLSADTLSVIASLKLQVLLAIAEDDYLLSRLFLKGGTAIDYQLHEGLGRSSTDLDFSVEGPLPPLHEVERHFTDALTQRFADQPFVAFDITVQEKPRPQPPDKTTWPDFWGGYRVSLKLVRRGLWEQLGGAANLAGVRRQAEVVGDRQHRTFKVEISKHEYVGDHYDMVTIAGTGEVVFAYSVPLLIAEKLRAICQQLPEYPHGHSAKRSRDYFDILRLATTVADRAGLVALLAQIVPPVFAAKAVPVEWLQRVDDADVVDHHRDDFETRLRATVQAGQRLPPFEHFVGDVGALADAILAAIAARK